MAVCKTCSKQFGDEFEICPYCGTIRDMESSPSSDEVETLKCPVCGFVFAADFGICPKCGLEFEPKSSAHVEDEEQAGFSSGYYSRNSFYIGKPGEEEPSKPEYEEPEETPPLRDDDFGYTSRYYSENTFYIGKPGEEEPLEPEYEEPEETPPMRDDDFGYTSRYYSENTFYIGKPGEEEPSEPEYEEPEETPPLRDDNIGYSNRYYGGNSFYIGKPDNAAAAPAVNSEPEPPAQSDEDSFLSLNELLIDENISVFRFTNSYKVYNMSGKIVGTVEQEEVSAGAKAARVLMGSRAKAMQKFRYNIIDADGKRLGAVFRDGGGLSPIMIENKNRTTIGRVSRGQLIDKNGSVKCSFKSDFWGNNIELTDNSGKTIGEVHKKWNGIGKELFTTADKYYVKIDPQISGEIRNAVFSIALVYDIILHEYH